MNNQTAETERVEVVSLRVDVVNHDAAIRKIHQLVKAKKGGYVCVSTVHMVMEAFDNPEFGAKVNAADLVVPDGMPLVWMQKLQGVRRASRTRGNDLMIKLFEFAARNDLSVGFYGGKTEVIEKIRERAKTDFPNLQIVYAFSPPFRALSEEENAEIVEEINRQNPDILFVGLGCPKQEIWMSEHKESLNAVMLGVGAAFDFYAGNIKESPEWISNFGFEWLFRLAQEPRRLWKRYLILNPRFIWQATKQLSKNRTLR